jgi:hypothetical protein
MESILVRASIDCMLNSGDVVDCFSAGKHFKNSDKYVSSTDTEKKGITVNEIVVDGKKVWIRKNPFEVYIKYKNNSKFMKLKTTDNLYKKVFKYYK